MQGPLGRWSTGKRAHCRDPSDCRSASYRVPSRSRRPRKSAVTVNRSDAGWKHASDESGPTASMAPLTRRHLARLSAIAAEDRVGFLGTHTRFRRRVIAVVLAQGAATHYVTGAKGVKDLDVDVLRSAAQLPTVSLSTSGTGTSTSACQCSAGSSTTSAEPTAALRRCSRRCSRLGPATHSALTAAERPQLLGRPRLDPGTSTTALTSCSPPRRSSVPAGVRRPGPANAVDRSGNARRGQYGHRGRTVRRQAGEVVGLVRGRPARRGTSPGAARSAATEPRAARCRNALRTRPGRLLVAAASLLPSGPRGRSSPAATGGRPRLGVLSPGARDGCCGSCRVGRPGASPRPAARAPRGRTPDSGRRSLRGS
jgi:hypothetical protein